MKFSKSELTKASKDIAYANTKVIDAIGACEDLFRNEVFNYILTYGHDGIEEFEEVLMELAKRLKKYSKDLFAGDTEENVTTLADATRVFKSTYGKIDEIK